MKCREWREVPSSALQPLYEAERKRWAEALHWDPRASWEIVEAARAAGRLPGYIAASSSGEILGWGFFVLHGDILQIGGLVSSRGAVVRALLQAILASPEARAARRLTGFFFPHARSSFESALARCRFRIRRHLYLSRALSDRPVVARGGLQEWTADLLGPAARAVSWRRADAAAAVRLLARAYAGEASAEIFAPRGSLEEWAQYLGQLVRTPICGSLCPEASYVIENRHSGHALGMVLTTQIGPGTAHLAQLVVDPEARRHGMGDALVKAACDAVAAAGYERVTLLVDEGHAAAVALYARHRFEAISAFLSAARSSPGCRSLSVATGEGARYDARKTRRRPATAVRLEVPTGVPRTLSRSRVCPACGTRFSARAGRRTIVDE